MRVKKFKITLVDDGSTDQTWKIISKLNIEDSRVKGLKLSKNFGQSSSSQLSIFFTLIVLLILHLTSL